MLELRLSDDQNAALRSFEFHRAIESMYGHFRLRIRGRLSSHTLQPQPGPCQPCQKAALPPRRKPDDLVAHTHNHRKQRNPCRKFKPEVIER
jgi:hypothetical protein